jgi:hypothetical protein
MLIQVRTLRYARRMNKAESSTLAYTKTLFTFPASFSYRSYMFIYVLMHFVKRRTETPNKTTGCKLYKNRPVRARAYENRLIYEASMDSVLNISKRDSFVDTRGVEKYTNF